MSLDLATIGVEFQTGGLVQGQQALRNTEAAANRMADATDRASKQASAFDRVMAQAAKTAGILTAAFGASEVIRQTDEYIKFTAQLKLATRSAEEFARANADVQRIAKETQAGLAQTGVLYARITNATRDMGTSAAEVARITETVGLALKVSGATAAEAASAQLQLSQAFGSGALRGEEFNAVNEAAPRLMEILAQSLGVTRGALKGMATEGQLTSQVLSKAFADEKTLAGLREQGQQVQTISGAYQNLKDQIMLFIGQQSEAHGTAKLLSSVLNTLANNLDLVSAAVTGVAVAKGAQTLIGIAQAAKAATVATVEQAVATAAQRQADLAGAQAKVTAAAAQIEQLQATKAAIVTSREMLVAELQLATATRERGVAAAQTAAIVTELAVLGRQQASVTAQLAAATAAQATAEAGLATARTAGAGAAALAGRALGFLGGPIGAITTLLGLGVTAWMAWGQAAEKQSTDAKKTVIEQGDELLAQLDAEIDKLKQRNALAKVGLQGIDQGPIGEKIASLNYEYNRLSAESGKTFAEEAVRKEELRLVTLRLAAAIQKQNEMQAESRISAENAGRGPLKELYAKYATDAEKLANALADAREKLGGAALPPDLEKRIRDSFNKKNVAEFNAELEAQRKLVAELSGVHGDYQEKLGRLFAVFKAGKIPQSEYVELVKRLIAEQPGAAKVLKAQADAIKQVTDAEADGIKLHEQYVETLARSAQSQVDRVEQLKLESEASRIAEAQGISLARAIETVTIARLEEKRAAASAANDTAAVAALEREIAARKELMGLLASKETRDAATQYAADISRALTDSLFRAFESGKGFFRSFWDGIKNTVKATVLKVPIQYVASAITGALGLTGTAANAASGSSGLLGTVSSIGNYFSSGSFFTSLGNFTGGLRAGVSSLTGGIDAFVGGLDAATTALQAGNIAGAVGTALPYAAAAYAAYQLISKLFDGGGGPKTESTFDTGYASLARPGSDPKFAQGISDSIEAAYQQLAETLGLAVRDLQVGVFTAIDSAGDALTQLQVVARQSGQEIYNRGARLGGDGTGSSSGGIENVGRSEAELQAAINDEIGQVLLAALRSSDLPEKFRVYIQQATNITEAVNTVAAVAQLDKAFRAMGGPLADLTKLSVDAELAFVNQLGGVQALGAALDSYYQNFYTEGERQAAVLRSVKDAFTGLGIAMPATRDAFRQLLDGALSSGDTGMAGKLLQLQAAFAQVVPAAEDAAQAVTQLGVSAEVLAQRTQLMISLYQAAGNSTAALALQRQQELAGLDASNRGLQEHVYAIEDARSAVDAATQAYNDAMQAAQQRISALQQQESDAQQVLSTLQQEAQQWLSLQQTALGLMNSISVSLGQADQTEATLLARLSSGTVDEQLQAAQQLYELYSRTNQANTQAQQTALSNAQRLLDLGRSLQSYVQSLRVGNLSALTPAEQLAKAQQGFQAKLTAAQSGDEKALAEVQSAASAYLQLAQQFDPGAYQAVFNVVTGALDQLGGGLVSANAQQVELLQAQIDAANAGNGLSAEQVVKLTNLQGVVQVILDKIASGSASAQAGIATATAQLSAIRSTLEAARAETASISSGVAAAQAALLAAQQRANDYLAQIAAQGGVGGGKPSESDPRVVAIRAVFDVVPHNESGVPDLIKSAQRLGLTSDELDAIFGVAPGTSLEAANRHGLPAFAAGGYHQGGLAVVGEAGAELADFAQPARVYSNKQLGDALRGNGSPELLAEMRALRAEVQMLREQNNQGHALNAQATATGTDRVARGMEQGLSKAARNGQLAQLAVPT